MWFCCHIGIDHSMISCEDFTTVAKPGCVGEGPPIAETQGISPCLGESLALIMVILKARTMFYILW